MYGKNILVLQLMAFESMEHLYDGLKLFSCIINYTEDPLQIDFVRITQHI